MQHVVLVATRGGNKPFVPLRLVIEALPRAITPRVRS